MNEYLLHYPSCNGPLIVAVQRAITETFSKSDRNEVGHLTGLHAYITGHQRLLRSLDWGDPDYTDCVFEVITRLQHHNGQALALLTEHPKVLPLLEVSVPSHLHLLGISVGHVRAVTPSLSASEVVRRALTDADQLIETNGAQSAVDRLHTAMHGYLKAECAAASIAIPPRCNPDPGFQSTSHQSPGID